MANFDLNAILRGAQLTLVGANRALQNPNLFKHEHYRQAALAVAIGIVIQAIVSLPRFFVQFSFWFLAHFMDLEEATWDDEVINILDFVQHSVLQVPFFLMNLLKFLNPALDNMFMESLDWVDKTYKEQHNHDDPSHLRGMYYHNLKKWHDDGRHKKSNTDTIFVFLQRYGRKAVLSLTVLLLSYTPVLGRFVMPAISFYYFRSAVGQTPALIIFASGIFVPKHYLVRFLQTFFSSRTLMRELLQPYFRRIPFDAEQKQRWFKDREGVLFGFGAAFFIMIKIPLVGVLVYGIAEASTAYLLTKITDPPPPPTADKSEKSHYVESQVRWKNKSKFLDLGLFDLDSLNAGKRLSDKGSDHHHHHHHDDHSKDRHTPTKKYT